jgi:hypothetical protein
MMGLTTEFKGKFELDKHLDPSHLAYLSAFNRTRRMKWSETALQDRPDPIREAVALPVGPEGAFFVGKEIEPLWEDPAISDYNSPPEGQPGLWCQWHPIDDGAALAWDGGDKFYCYVEWLQYLIDHFIQLWGYELNGEVTWESEVQYHWSEDLQNDAPCISLGKIMVEGNIVQVERR